jgi:hypothetical protein
VYSLCSFVVFIEKEESSSKTGFACALKMRTFKCPYSPLIHCRRLALKSFKLIANLLMLMAIVWHASRDTPLPP